MSYVAELLDGPDIIAEALANFAVLIDDLDFGVELNLMGIGRLQFLRHRQMQIELKGLYIALWRLALAKSFPAHADSMFSTFLINYKQIHPNKLGLSIVERAAEYWGMLAPTGDADFNDVARHLLSFIKPSEKDFHALTLRMALHIRSAYRFIFDRLI